MFPLVAIAAQFVPEIIKLIAGDKAGKVAIDVATVVSTVTGKTDPVEAMQAVKADPAVEADLREKLAQIAVDAQKAQNDEADKQRQAELDTLKATMADTQNARVTMLGLAQAKSWIAWGAPIVSIVVALGFFVVLFILLRATKSIDPDLKDVLYVTIGTMGTAFATVVNFWVGSSQGSKDKDTALATMQANHAEQFTQALTAVTTATGTAVSEMGSVRGVLAGAPVPDFFDRCVTITLMHEGGFSEDPNDPGGATNFGITKRTLEAYRGKVVSVNDVRNLSSAEAREIYRANFWNLMRCGDLPAGLDLMVFDYGVNSGPSQAVKNLQALVGVNQDGAIGNITLPAVKKIPPVGLIGDLASGRLEYLKTLATYATYKDGWTSRVEDIKQSALKMVK